MLFSYKAVKEDGTKDEGTRQATSRMDLAHELERGRETVLHIEEIKKSQNIFSVSFFQGIPATEKISLAKNLSVMIRSGLPLTRALDVIEKQSKNKRLKRIVNSVIDSINRGDSLTAALSKFPKVFNKLFTSIIHSGEESGRLVEALATVSYQLGRSDNVSRKIRGALLYPVIIFSLMVAVGVLMMIYVVPQLVTTFASLHADLPFETRVIIGISNLLQTQGLWFPIGIIALIFLFSLSLKTKKGKRIFDWCAMHTPFVETIVTQNNSARAARTLGSLLSSGVDMIEALRITEDVVPNVYFKDVVHEAEEKIEKGLTLSKVFIAHEKIFPIYLAETAAVGEETGNLAGMLLSVAENYENDVEEKMKNVSTVIEPVMMIIVGVAVGFFAVAVISPMYSLVNTF